MLFLADTRKLSGKETGDMLFEVFPLQMICISKNLPSIVILNVAVIVVLPVDPATESLLIPLGACILLQPGTCFDGVWSRFITIDFCILLWKRSNVNQTFQRPLAFLLIFLLSLSQPSVEQSPFSRKGFLPS